MEDYRNGEMPLRLPEEYETTDDRMLSMRRRLSPGRKLNLGRN